jgi:hypothetical protein
MFFSILFENFLIILQWTESCSRGAPTNTACLPYPKIRAARKIKDCKKDVRYPTEVTLENWSLQVPFGEFLEADKKRTQTLLLTERKHFFLLAVQSFRKQQNRAYNEKI